MFRKTLVLTALFLALTTAQDDAFEEAEDAAADAADDFGDEVEDAVDEGEGVFLDAQDGAVDASGEADVAAEVAVDAPKTLAEEAEEEDLWVLLIGISSVLDTLWWLLWGWFIYVKTNAQDSTMCFNSDCATSQIPLSWFWGALADTKLSWTAINYLFIFLFYLLISVPEMVFWVVVMIGESTWGLWLFNIWVKWPGLYGSWILYFLTVLFPIIQLVNLAEIGNNQPGELNATVQLVMMLITWLFTGIVHVLGFPYVERKYQKYAEANPTSDQAAPAEPAPVAEPTEDASEVEDGDDFEGEEEAEDEEADDFEDEVDDAEEAF